MSTNRYQSLSRVCPVRHDIGVAVRGSWRPYLPILTLLLVFGVLGGCATPREIEREPRRRDYKSPYDANTLDAKPSEGSLYSQQGPVGDFFVDQRAFRVGDVITIKIAEKSSAAGSAGTQLSKSTAWDANIEALMGLMDKLEDISPVNKAQLIKAATAYTFKGEGNTKREGSLSATVTSQVMQVLPNGNLFIEGTKTILVNSEEQYFYISGVVRPIDVTGENVVSSDLLSEAQVEFTGQGIISDIAEPGWLSSILSWIWPF